MVSVQEEFFLWLSKKVSPAQLSDYCIACIDIEKFCLQERILGKNLFETTDLKAIESLVEFISSNQVYKKFRATYGHNLSKTNAALKYYCDFLKTTKNQENIKSVKIESPAEKIFSNKEIFKDWLKFQYTNKMTALICFETIADINKMLKSEKISSDNLFLITDSKKLVEIKDLLLSTKSFKILNEKQRNVILTAFYNLVKFCQGNSKTEKIPTPPVKSETSTEKNLSKIDKYAEILNKYFGENGYQPGKIRFRNRFKQFFFEEYGENISDSEEQFEEILKELGTQRDDRLFPKQNDNQNELINDIVNDIVAAFDSGASAVFIEAVYDKYQKPLAENLKVYNADACVPLILENANGKFFKYGTYFNPRIRKAAPVEDIMRFMQEIHQPLAYNQICSALWYIPQSKLKVLLNQISAVVRVGNDLFFYAPNLPLDETELQKVSSMIQSEIDFHGYITDVKMMTLIKSKYPMIASNLDEFSTYAVRNCLRYIFNERFAFNGSVISSLGSQLNLSEVYADFAREHENLTLDELKDFAKELDSTISWFPVLSEMVRVSQNKFVRKDFINFNVNVIDKFLEEMYPQNYIPLKEVTLFINFPNVGYAWNIYLLESYLYSFSHKFRLIHNSFAESGVYGAMVRVGSSISDYESLITDALSYSDSLTESKALQFIVDQGYQQRKTYKYIGNVIRKAKILKENRRRKSF